MYFGLGYKDLCCYFTQTKKKYRILIVFKYKCSEEVCDAILTKTEEDSMYNLS